MSQRSALLKHTKSWSGKPIDLLLSHRTARKKVISLIKKKIEKDAFKNTAFPKKVQEDKCKMANAIIAAFEKALTGAKNASHVRKAIINFLLNSIFYKDDPGYKNFGKNFGVSPPAFLVVSPGEFCNLRCKGCYANSTSSSSGKLDWDILNRIISEKTQLWGSHFTVISGGEPFLYESQGKSIVDLAQAHPDNYFLIFTNGTVIDKKVAQKIARIGNITPAISVEGFEKETDARRGKGVWKKIISAMESLNAEGVPFGISVTATRDNADIVIQDEFAEEYFGKMGACYAWYFQIMPIGRAECLSLMVTPEQRVKMFKKTRSWVNEKEIMIADFWNSGCVSNGCISAGRGGGYFYIEWNGNATPCVFNPYSPINIKDVYRNGGNLNTVLKTPFFQAIRDWQQDYALSRKPDEMGNLIAPCAIKDHYDTMKKMLKQFCPKPIDEAAAKALVDPSYEKELIKYGQDVKNATEEIWQKEYLKKK